MKQVVSAVAISVLLASAAQRCAWAASDSVVSGVVRDAHGVPQMGALVELLGPDTAIIAKTFTDEHGRYLLRAAGPGNYRLRATAAFLTSTSLANLRLRSGVRTVADLSMTALLQAGSLLPTEKRTSTEPTDDWRWTLRSTANRPLLRIAGTGGQGSIPGVSSSEDHHPDAVSRGQITFMAGDGTFGQGGTHQVITLDRAGLDGAVSVLRANLGDTTASGAGNSVTLSAGLERVRPWGGGTRLFLTFASHPEVQTGAGTGLQILRTATTEKIVLGDTVSIDAGTLLTAEHLAGTSATSAPYIRVALHPSQDVSIEYRLATDRTLQSSEGLDEIALPEQALSDAQGRPMLKKSLHQELAVINSQEKTVLTFAVFDDHVPVESVQGGGPLQQADLAALPVIMDPGTGTMRLAVHGYAGEGVRLAWEQSFSPVLSASVEGAYGSALRANRATQTFADAPRQIGAHATGTLVGTLRIATKQTGTTLDVRYRWQPLASLTQVDAFDAVPGDAYLGVRLKQKLWSGRRVKRVNAVVEATNLLAEGYQPLLAADGQTVFLAQMPRAIQGGLAFSF